MKAIIQIFSVIIFWFPFSSLQGQGIYFNKTLDLGIHWAAGMTAIPNDSVYHIGGISGWAITIVEIDTTGNEVHWIKRYNKPGEESWYPGSQGNLSRVPTGGYCQGGGIAIQDTNIGLFVRFNAQFDTLFTRRFTDPVNYSLITTCAVPTFDEGFMLASELYMGGYHADILLLKTDSLGNELWRTSKSFGWWDRPWSMVQTPDSGFVVGGHTYRPGVYQSGDPLIAKFNKYGQFIWSQNPGGSFNDYYAMVCLSGDGTITAVTTIGDSVFSNDYSYARICLIRYSQDGEEIWKKFYGESIIANSVLNLIPLPDGGFVCCGSQPEPGNVDVSRAGFLFRLNSEGDSLWFRKYHYTNYPSPNVANPFSLNRLYDVSPTDDNGFIATGYTFDDPPYDLKKMWVLKLDSLGCDTAGCNPTVGFEETGEHVSGEAGNQCCVVVWPNPAREVLSVKVLGLSEGIVYSLEIYDIFGRLAPGQITSLPPGVGRAGDGGWTVDVSGLSPGIYLLIVRDQGKRIGSAKFMVVR